MASPKFELYNYIFDRCEEWKFNTYDHLPQETENAVYPFVICGDQQQTDSVNKSAIGATIYTTVHVWGSRRQQEVVDSIAEQIATLGNQAFKTEHYRFIGRPNLIDNQMMTDDTIPNAVLWHSVVTMAFDLH